MSAGYYHECDQCGKQERVKGCGEPWNRELLPRGWLFVHCSSYWVGTVEACSFACLVAYGQEHGWNDAVKVEGK